MSKKIINKAKGDIPLRTSVNKQANTAPLMSSVYLPYLIIFLFSTGLYFNTLWNKYAIDDIAVLTENSYTLKGFGGIKDIMTHDALVGYLGSDGDKLVGTRYRPLSMVTLAIEVGLWGQNPAVSHSINILLFTLSCMLLYHLLISLLPASKGTVFYLSIPFITAMLFAGHPIHTEAVANIKGRDEIMALLFSLLAALATVKYVKTNNHPSRMGCCGLFAGTTIQREPCHIYSCHPTYAVFLY